MKKVLSAAIVTLMLAVGQQAQTAPDAVELTKLLKEFLDGASRNDASMHDRFWAEDLIYTGSAGRRISKADIMRDVRSAAPPKSGDPVTTYSAEDVRIQQYGDTAVVAFRLVGTNGRGDRVDVSKYLNSGTFLKRNGKWQAMCWQATRIPRPEEEAKRDVAATESAFHQAILGADVKTLESVVDESFVWVSESGEQMTRQQLLDQLGSRRLKYSRIETSGVSVTVYGDAGVVRGVSLRQRASMPGPEAFSDARPYESSYTLTFVYKGGAWKAVAMHSSRR